MRTQLTSQLPLLLATLVATPGSAEIVSTTYEADDLYTFVVYDMPDFDQKRLNDLPNDGACYCGPAASGNLLAYVATHGYPQVSPGIPFWHDWENQLNYDKATSLLSNFGAACGTGPTTPSCG
ncbi:MAG: hypothetical protein MK085_06775, partial [Phycisphaerales bacterium]|nr:hypothetical protein [Phycisphaerales bacterium]